MRHPRLRNVFKPVAVAVLSWSCQAGAAELEAFKAKAVPLIEKEKPSLLEIYKDLHAHPETSFVETRTAAFVASEFRKLGIEVTENVGNKGVVGVFRNGPGPTLLFRGDMDGLPLLEKTGLPYASKEIVTDLAGRQVPAMHGCGHDMHVTNLIGSARLLVALKDHWSGTLVFMAQPAEEIVAGARAMLQDGLFTRFPKPDYALALHISGGEEAGKIRYCEGALYANVSSVDIQVRGVGTHGSTPERGKDPIVLASHIVLALQTIVSREIHPGVPAVVTVGTFHGGLKRNIISDEAKLELTLRSYDSGVMEHLKASIKRIAENEGRAFGLPEDKLPVVTFTPEATPETINNQELTRRLSVGFKAWVGPENAEATEPIMGAEDFGLLGRTAEKIPICIWQVGATSKAAQEEADKKGVSVATNHSPFFAPDPEPTLDGCLNSTLAAVATLAGK